MGERIKDEVRDAVRETYGKIARESGGCCGPSAAGSGCCGPVATASERLGYTAEDLAAVPEGADLGLGCGNPQAIAALRPGETVLDLGSGAGFDAFLASRQVGPTGKVIGVDMTPDMITKARANAEKVAASNVEFRLGEIERMPVADGTVDVILSNCVINLSPDKRAVFTETFRVLRDGGRLAISDVVAIAPIPAALRDDAAAYTGCVAGAAQVDELRAMLESVGFTDVSIAVKESSRDVIADWFPGSASERFVASANIEARKTKAGACCAPGCCS